MRTGIVNLNFSIERVYAVPGFSAGKVYRPESPVTQAGGKGINVARVLRTLGNRAELTGCVGGHAGRWILQDLRQQRLPVRPYTVVHESRTCLTIFDTSRALQTVINEPGNKLSKTDVAALLCHLAHFVQNKSAVVFSGSVLPGISPADYGRMIGNASAKNRTVFVDVSGEHLRAALRHKPFLIKPNLEEWRQLAGRRLRTKAAIKASVRFALAGGVRWVVLSCGREGLLAFHGGCCYDVTVPAVKVVNAVGCGDALVAGFVKASLEERRPDEMVRFAAAVACAHALTAVPGQVKTDDVRALLPRIRIVTGKFRI
jgi:tagatose 6-phosphate kinase